GRRSGDGSLAVAVDTVVQAQAAGGSSSMSATPTIDPLVAAASATARGERAVPPFAPGRLARQLVVDALARWGLFLLLFLMIVVGAALESPEQESGPWSGVPVLLVSGV